jgi:hypothetical protein
MTPSRLYKGSYPGADKEILPEINGCGAYSQKTHTNTFRDPISAEVHALR